MNDTPQDAWFYSMQGERLGPVTFSELRVKALEGALNPRLDMAWTKGMNDWKPAGEIEGLFERRAVPADVQSAMPAEADPYRAPEHEGVSDPMAREAAWPGARRRSYLFMAIVFPVAWQFAANAATPWLNGQFGLEMMKTALPALVFLPVLFAIYFTVKRFVNLGMSGWWIFGNLVPFLNLWLGYRCFACPAGYAFHKKLDGAGIFLAIVYWLLIAGAIVAAALVIAVLVGAAGSPEFQKQLREALEKSGTPAT